MGHNTKNYSVGGNQFVIGGELTILPTGKITAGGEQAASIEDHKDPAKAKIADVAVKQNQILAALRAVGIIAGTEDHADNH